MQHYLWHSEFYGMCAFERRTGFSALVAPSTPIRLPKMPKAQRKPPPAARSKVTAGDIESSRSRSQSLAVARSPLVSGKAVTHFMNAKQDMCALLTLAQSESHIMSHTFQLCTLMCGAGPNCNAHPHRSNFQPSAAEQHADPRRLITNMSSYFWLRIRLRQGSLSVFVHENVRP